MKSATQLVKAFNKTNMESAIHEYHLLCLQITALEAKRLRKKEELVKAYFADHEEYVDEEGRVLATYKEELRPHLDSIRLKIAYPDLYEQFFHYQRVKVLRLK